MKHKTLEKLSFLILIVGGINWGLIGLLNYNLIQEILGNNPNIPKLIYLVVGVAAVYAIYIHFGKKK